MSSNMYFRISPTSTYVVFVENPLEPTTGLMYKVVLPDFFVNNEIGAKNYFLNRIDDTARIIACLPFEICSDEIKART